MIDEVLGVRVPLDDLNLDGVVNVVDVERQTQAVLTGKCSYT